MNGLSPYWVSVLIKHKTTFILHEFCLMYTAYISSSSQCGWTNQCQKECCSRPCSLLTSRHATILRQSRECVRAGPYPCPEHSTLSKLWRTSSGCFCLQKCPFLCRYSELRSPSIIVCDVYLHFYWVHFQFHVSPPSLNFHLKLVGFSSQFPLWGSCSAKFDTKLPSANTQ